MAPFLSLLVAFSGLQGCRDPGDDTGGPQGRDTGVEQVPAADGVSTWQDPPLCHVEVSCTQEIPDEPKVPCHLLVAAHDGTVSYDGPAGFELRGRSSLSFPKHNYAVELWEDETGIRTVSHDFFEMGGEDDWILHGGYVDRSLMRDKLIFDLFQSMGGMDRYAPQQVFCELTLDGSWQGIYTLREHIRRDDDRLDLEDSESAFIVKNDDDEGGLLEASPVYGMWFLVWPDPEDAPPARVEAIRQFLDTWQDIVEASSQDDPDPTLYDFIDMDNAIDWILIQEFAKNHDTYFLSVWAWKDAAGRMRLIPWDIDLSFGYPYYDCGWEGWIKGRTEFAWKLGQVPAFQERIVERWAELRSGVLATDAVLGRMAAYRAILGDTVYQNFEVWPFEEIEFVWGDTSWLCPVESYDAEYEGMRTWAAERLLWMDTWVAHWWTGAPNL
ncbi:MAG: CotH kinase family protein [Deltaproteobacteria bacterium]|nr:CotH kinase family protein [Deltaproteobacteria bacterium]